MFEKAIGAVRRVKGSVLAFLVSLVTVGAGVASAQTTPTFDTSTIVATIGAVAAAAALVGAAYVAMRIGVKAWKWLTGAA